MCGGCLSMPALHHKSLTEPTASGWGGTVPSWGDGVEENGQFVRQLWLCEEIKHPEKCSSYRPVRFAAFQLVRWKLNGMGNCTVRADPKWEQHFHLCEMSSGVCLLRVVVHKNWGTVLNNHPRLWKCWWMANCVGLQVCVLNNMQFKLGQNTLL